MRKRIFSPCGERFVKKHGYIYENGERKFAEVGEVDMQTRIVNAGQGTTLYENIQRYLVTGDDSFLYAKVNALSTDISEMPKSLIELYTLKDKCADDFNHYPADFKALFNNNLTDYVKAIKDDTINDTLKKYLESKGKDIPTEGGDEPNE